MAKQNYLKLAVVIVLSMAAASTVYAGAGTAINVSTGSIGGSSFTPSNKVSCFYDSDVSGTGVFTGTAYGIACGHLTGDKVIAARNGDAKLYFKSTSQGSAAAGAATIVSTETFTATTWTSM